MSNNNYYLQVTKDARETIDGIVYNNNSTGNGNGNGVAMNGELPDDKTLFNKLEVTCSILGRRALQPSQGAF